MPIRFQSAKLLWLFLIADDYHNKQALFKISWLLSMILRRFSYSEKYVSQDKWKRTKQKKGEAMPLPVKQYE